MTGHIKAAIPPGFFSESAVATFIVASNHEVIFWNKACEALTGIHAGRVLSTRNQWMAFYEAARPCLADIVIDGDMARSRALYEEVRRSDLSPKALRAEGWYERLGGRRRYITFDAAPIFDASGRLVAAIETLHDLTDIKCREREKEEIIALLKATLSDRAVLPGVLKVCASCKGIRDDSGQWLSLEEYLSEHLGLKCSHGICLDCVRKFYPEFYAR